jgi:lysozyme family protein
MGSLDNIFNQAIENVLKNEGGYVNDPYDPGGETIFGISKRIYPHLDIKNITRNQAIDIYKKQYWENTAYPLISTKLPLIAIKIFDLSVNMGNVQANRLLQRACRSIGSPLVEDGYLGPKSLKVIMNSNQDLLLCSFKSEAAGYYRVLCALKSSNYEFLNGWLSRAYE